MKLLPLLLLSSPAFAQTCLTSIEVRKVNDLLDSYEALQEDSATFVQWKDAYTQCENIRVLEQSQLADLTALLDIERTRSKALAAMNERSERKAKRRARLVWILGGTSAAGIVTTILSFGLSK